MRKTIATLCATTALLAAGVAAGPASAHQQGLVNVEITNVLNDNKVNVAIPINAAANICGVTVAVLAEDLTSGAVTCDARANQRFTITQ